MHSLYNAIATGMDEFDSDCKVWSSSSATLYPDEFKHHLPPESLSCLSYSH